MITILCILKGKTKESALKAISEYLGEIFMEIKLKNKPNIFFSE
ncbi:hypothetical protein ECAD30_21050 [Escherichia coli AD30]|nr:hypothetical protein ECAD30_21050 [Escherichia coli AD30]